MIEGPINVADFERLASEKLEPGVLAYFAGGAGDEATLRDNVAAWGRWQLRPRMLTGIEEWSARAEVLGAELSMPVLVAPVAFQRLVDPEGEAAMARAAAAAGTLMCVSTLATATAREVSAAAPGAPRWFQLYVLRDRGVTHALVDEAVACGYRALVVTVDAPRAGRRERDLRTGFAVPAGMDMPGVSAAAGHSAGLTPADFFSLVDASLTWKDLERLVEAVELPVIVKGVHAAADARLAIEHGAAAVVVSNHGGRQLDGVPAGIDLLEDVVQEVAGDVEVLVDGGVRRGPDILNALALGARAVLVGRPLVWGLAWDGEAGARWVLETLRAELELDLMLLGAPSPAAVTRAHLL